MAMRRELWALPIATCWHDQHISPRVVAAQAAASIHDHVLTSRAISVWPSPG